MSNGKRELPIIDYSMSRLLYSMTILGMESSSFKTALRDALSP